MYVALGFEMVSAAPQSDAQQSGRAEPQGPTAKAARLGVTVEPLTAAARARFGAPADRGVMIAAVDAGSPAERAGLRVGDVLVAIDRSAIASGAAIVDATSAPAAMELDLAVIRDRRYVDVKARLDSPATR